MPRSRREFLGMAAAAGMLPSVAALTRSSREGAPHTRPAIRGLRERESDDAVLACVGDLFLMEEFPERVAPETEEVYEILRGSDAAFANLENGLSTLGAPELGGFRHGGSLRGSPSLVTELTRAGVTAVSLANNHTGNYGPEALLETLRTLDAAGVEHAGAGEDIEHAFAPAYFTVQGKTLGFLSVYSYYYNYGATDNASVTKPGIAGSRAYDVMVQLASGFEIENRDDAPYLLEPRRGGSQVVMAPLYEDMTRMSTAIAEARARADIVILSVHFHWGRHTKADLPFQQRLFAQTAVDAGADIVVGHGPHMLRGIEVYRGRPIFYSLANFVLRGSDGSSGEESRSGAVLSGRDSLVVRVSVSAERIVEVELLPIIIGDDGQPRLDSSTSGQRIVQAVAALSADLGTEVEARESLGVIDLS